jgi:hypothetical protein
MPGVGFAKWLILVPFYSVYSVVIAEKLTTEYTENTEKALNKLSIDEHQAGKRR